MGNLLNTAKDGLDGTGKIYQNNRAHPVLLRWIIGNFIRNFVPG